MSRRRRALKRRRRQADPVPLTTSVAPPIRMLRLVPPPPPRAEAPVDAAEAVPVPEGEARRPAMPRRSLLLYYMVVGVMVGLVVLSVLRWLDTPPAPILIPTGF